MHKWGQKYWKVKNRTRVLIIIDKHNLLSNILVMFAISLSKQIFSKYIFINANRFTYVGNRFIKNRAPIQYDVSIRWHLTSIGNPIVEIRQSYDRLIPTMGFPILVRRHLYIETGSRSLVPLDLNFMLGSYAFSPQAATDHHGFSMYSGHFTASVYCCEKTFYCNDDKITICDINNWSSSNTYVRFINCLWSDCTTRTLRVGNIFTHGTGTFCPSQKLQVEE